MNSFQNHILLHFIIAVLTDTYRFLVCVTSTRKTHGFIQVTSRMLTYSSSEYADVCNKSK